MAKLPKTLTIGEWQTVTNFVREHKAEDVALLIIQYEREIGQLKKDNKVKEDTIKSLKANRLWKIEG